MIATHRADAVRIVGWTVLALALVAGIGGALFAWSGAYDVAANVPHTQWVHSLLESSMNRSVRMRARHIAVPGLDDERLIATGAGCYRDRCVICHGAPGTAQGEIGRSMQPLPGPLVDAAARWTPAELYWITRHGIKMSGMPAWEYRLADEDLWALVAFMQRLPRHTVASYRQSTATAPACRPRSDPVMSGDPARGRVALSQYACTACHVIPGTAGSATHVGPPLDGIASRRLIAGALPNSTAHMVRWIRDPASVDAQTAMPDMGVTERDAHDIASYLATLR